MFLEKPLVPLTQILTANDAIDRVKKHGRYEPLINTKNIFVLFLDQNSWLRHTYWFPFGKFTDVDLHFNDLIEVSRSTDCSNIWIVINRTNYDCTPGYLCLTKSWEWSRVFKLNGIVLKDVVILGHLLQERFASLNQMGRL